MALDGDRVWGKYIAVAMICLAGMSRDINHRYLSKGMSVYTVKTSIHTVDKHAFCTQPQLRAQLIISALITKK